MEELHVLTCLFDGKSLDGRMAFVGNIWVFTNQNSAVFPPGDSGSPQMLEPVAPALLSCSRSWARDMVTWWHGTGPSGPCFSCRFPRHHPVVQAIRISVRSSCVTVTRLKTKRIWTFLIFLFRHQTLTLTVIFSKLFNYSASLPNGSNALRPRAIVEGDKSEAGYSDNWDEASEHSERSWVEAEGSKRQRGGLWGRASLMQGMSKGNMVALSFVISEIVTATQKPVGLVS
jgi:hypothetical protein